MNVYVYVGCRELLCVLLNYYSLKAYRVEFSALFQRAILEIHGRHEIKSRQIKETVLTRGVFTCFRDRGLAIFITCLDPHVRRGMRHAADGFPSLS